MSQELEEIERKQDRIIDALEQIHKALKHLELHAEIEYSQVFDELVEAIEDTLINELGDE